MWMKPSKGAFTPDANEANKSCYSRVVGRLNILSLLASFSWENPLHSRVKYSSFAREIHYTTDRNMRHGGASAGSSSLVAKFIPVFVKVWSSIVQLRVPHTTTINLSSIVVSDFLPPLVITSLLEQAPDWPRNSRHLRRLIRANSATGLSIASLHWLNM